MPPPKAMPKPYVRRPVQKSFSGCARCKARKIKCDEKKPSCTQCGTKRAVCPGYATQPRLRWSRKHEILVPDQQLLSDKLQQAPATFEREDSIASMKSPSGGSPENTTKGNWISQPESAEVGDFDARRFISNSDKQMSSTDRTTPIGFSELSSQTESLPIEWDWGEELLYAFLNPDDTTSISHDHRPSLSTSSHSSPTSGLQLRQEASPENEAYQEIPIPEFSDEPFSISTGDMNSISQFQLPIHDSSASVDFNTSEKASLPQLSPQLVDTPGNLVAVYFSVVCPILSTFDSDQNVFRSFVNQRWQNSYSMFYTIQSMAAAKLVWIMPHMKAQAFQHRSMALNALYSTLSKTTSWDTESLFVMLMLGISSCWFDMTDLGIVHLQAVQHAILNDKVEFAVGFPSMCFFKNSLTYWEMVSSVVTDRVTFHDYSKVKPPQSEPLMPNRKPYVTSPPRIKPHPWTGVAAEPQALFTRTARQIRGLRSYGPASTAFGISLNNPSGFQEALKSLDEEIWACNLPRLHHISNSGDDNTPGIHHLLLAEAYLLANLYQLYSVFGNLRKRRVNWIKEKASHHHFNQNSWATDQISSWEAILQEEDGTEKWLKFLGRSVIIRLEQIQKTSGTSCVQALLLLVAATSLSVGVEHEGNGDEEEEICRLRQFVLNRLCFLSQSNLSAPISHVTSVVLEIFRLLDVGIDVFWIDILQSMGTITIIG
ncbi:fungal-specific transcription factor domain-containing protein [Mariannaea sp. PMI_226]|nr:fungal-specific transcription factor domain-containing protein [Mariannaea sp. PMI_226]